MKNLVILCAGSRMVGDVPLYLAQHPDGNIIAEKVVTGIKHNYDRIIYTILKESDENYNAEKIILENISREYPVEVVKLSEKTNGPAETVYKTIKQAEIDGELYIRDCHSYIEIDNIIVGNFVAGLDLSCYEKTIDNLRSKSFIVLNEQKQILDIVEKRFCSEVISAGLYGFMKTTDFIMAYEKLCDPNYPIKKLYISHIISYLIGYAKRVFHCGIISKFEDWSTSSSWMRIQKLFATYFLDLDAMNCINIPFASTTIDTLRRASQSGACFVAFTSKKINNKEPLLLYLEKNGISVLQIVDGCTVSKVKAIIDTKDLLDSTVLEV